MFTQTEILPLVRWGLENQEVLNCKSIRVSDVKILNDDTLCCHFHPFATNSMDIKGEMAAIMGFFNGFFRNGELGASFSNYALKAVDSNGRELMYAISSKEAAECIGKGKSLDWLKSTLFQENTADYRLAQAKRIISEIENGIRTAVPFVLEEHFGNNWWDVALGNKLGASVKEVYENQFGISTSDGQTLIKYTYTLQLKKIVSTHWPHFQHLFSSKQKFEDSMDELNLIRREEAHNREISEAHLNQLDQMHESLLAKISEIYPGIQSQYSIDNWRTKIKTIMSNRHKPIYTSDEIIGETDLTQKLLKSIQATKNCIRFLDDTISKIESVAAPSSKREMHRKLIDAFAGYRRVQSELLSIAETQRFDEVTAAVNRIHDQERSMNIFAEEFLLSEA